MASDDLCACGCGQTRPLYIHGHSRRDFLEHIEEDHGFTTPCWILVGVSKQKRYGQIRYGGGHVGAHRVAFELAKGAIPQGFHVDHVCRVTNCVNPDHLEAVPPRENIRRQPQVKLNPALVREIRESTETGGQIARRLGISASLVSLVRLRKLWTDVE